ncbi:unnamed protein product, partial [Ectocarpus fasciculatus]
VLVRTEERVVTANDGQMSWPSTTMLPGRWLNLVPTPFRSRDAGIQRRRSKGNSSTAERLHRDLQRGVPPVLDDGFAYAELLPEHAEEDLSPPVSPS